MGRMLLSLSLPKGEDDFVVAIAVPNDPVCCPRDPQAGVVLPLRRVSIPFRLIVNPSPR